MNDRYEDNIHLNYYCIVLAMAYIRRHCVNMFAYNYFHLQLHLHRSHHTWNTWQKTCTSALNEGGIRD